jgi:hypothetical protein
MELLSLCKHPIPTIMLTPPGAEQRATHELLRWVQPQLVIVLARSVHNVNPPLIRGTTLRIGEGEVNVLSGSIILKRGSNFNSRTGTFSVSCKVAHQHKSSGVG